MLREKIEAIIIEIETTPEEQATQIPALLKEEGYVKLADDQSFPVYGLPTGWIEMGMTEELLLSVYEEMHKRGFRKVELPKQEDYAQT